MRNLALQVMLGAVLVAAADGQSPADPTAEITSAIRARDYQQALQLVRSALERSPNDVRLLTMKAIALAATGNDRDALAAYNRTLQLVPDYLAALEGAAEIQYKAGDEHAVPLLDRILKLQPDNSTAHAMRGVMAWKQRDCQAAVRHFTLAGSAISSQPEALQEYGACLVRLERPAEAVSVLRRLLKIEPADRHVRCRLAATELMAKSYSDVIKTLGPLLEGKEQDPDALGLASAAWEAAGDTPRAVAALRQAIVLAPSNARLYVDFAALCLMHRSYEAGIAMLNAGLARLPDAAPLYVARGVLHVQLAQYDQSDADFAEAERLDPGQAYGSVARGLSQIQQNDFDKALVTVREQLKTQRNDEFLYYLLAEILASQGPQAGSPKFQEAVEAAKRAVQLKPNFALARDVLSRLYLESGQTEAAIAQCRLALHDNPLDATALYRLIRALQKSGLPGGAPEIQALLKRFNEVRDQLRKQEEEEARYKLVEGSPAPGQ